MKRISTLLKQCLFIGSATVFFVACSKEKLATPNSTLINQRSNQAKSASSSTENVPGHSIPPKVDFDFIINGLNVEFINKSIGGSNYVISDMTFEFGDKQVVAWNMDDDKLPCPTKVSHTYTRVPHIGYLVTLTIKLRDNITGIDATTLDISKLIPVHGPVPTLR